MKQGTGAAVLWSFLSCENDVIRDHHAEDKTHEGGGGSCEHHDEPSAQRFAISSEKQISQQAQEKTGYPTCHCATDNRAYGFDCSVHFHIQGRCSDPEFSVAMGPV